MRVENVELVQGYVFVPFGKTRAARRRIPLTATALAVLKRRIEAQTEDTSFPTGKTLSDTLRPLPRATRLHSETPRSVRSDCTTVGTPGRHGRQRRVSI